MYIRPDGKCSITVVITVEQKRALQEMHKNGFNPQVPLRKSVDEVIKTYQKIQTLQNMKGSKYE